jgi:hypothetical protein
MKYTKYLIDGKFIDMESLQSKNLYLKMPTRILSILVALVGITTISSIIPMAIMVDGYRNTKSRLIHFKRNGYKL